METNELRALWHLAFGDSADFIELFFSTAYAPERCRYLTVSGRIAAALYWLDAEYAGQKFAYLYAIATHPDFRNQGLCRRLMEETHTLLSEQGYAGTLLMPAKESLRKMYAKMGYQDCCSVSEFSCAAGTPIPVRQIEKAEYAQLRKNALPAGGAIQKGPSIDYLASYAQFYTGETFLLAAAPQNGQLHGIELLGSPEAAPGILAALGYSSGTFRTPGDAIPFVMFRPLTEHAVVPTYFGLVFD